MMKIRTITTAAAMVAALQCVSAQSADVSSALDALVESRYSDDAPGAAIIVARGDTILYERYIGVADMASGEKIGATTRFNIASCSKQFTVVGLLRLAELGLVDLDAPMTEHLPYLTHAIWHKITPRHLMSHTSGLPDSRPRHDRQATVMADDAFSEAYFTGLTELKFEPGSDYDYLNPSFILLSRIIERVAEVPFTVYQQRYLFEPAGMYATYYFDAAARPSRAAHGYLNAHATGDDGDTDGSPKVLRGESQWQEYDYGEETFFGTRPDGGIYSTARDLLAWEKALRCNTIISAAALSEAYTRHIRVTGSPWCDYQNRPNTWYGYGWFIDDIPGRRLKIYHTGDNGGYKAYLAKYPTDDTVVIVLENRCDLDRWAFGLAIERALYCGSE